tara:strand:+ start:60342 stop:61052 length:711 start_codon:yes stop_codon:yes gene_type:complete
MKQTQPLDWEDAVRAGGWFKSLPPNLASELLAKAQLQHSESGQRLFARGDADDGIYCLLKGSVRITGSTSGGSESMLVLLEPPQWFGEIALFDSAPRTHDAWVESKASFLHVTRKTLANILDKHPEYWKEFGRLLTQKVRILFSLIEDNSLLPATELIASRLTVMAKGFDSLPGQHHRVVRISQERLGLMLSLSRQTVNRSLKELESTGAIKRGRGVIKILEISKLVDRPLRDSHD